MVNELFKLYVDYGWTAVFLTVVLAALTWFFTVNIKVWRQRAKDDYDRRELLKQDELTQHQFFANLDFKLNTEIPTMVLDNKQPIRQKLFRKLLVVTLLSLKEIINTIITSDIDSMSPSQWSMFVLSELNQIERSLEEKALKEGIPNILVSKYLVWEKKSALILKDYITDLAISELYPNNLVRTNTLLFLLNLKLITIVGDAERSLRDLNGELTGLSYNGDTIE